MKTWNHQIVALYLRHFSLTLLKSKSTSGSSTLTASYKYCKTYMKHMYINPREIHARTPTIIPVWQLASFRLYLYWKWKRPRYRNRSNTIRYYHLIPSFVLVSFRTKCINSKCQSKNTIHTSWKWNIHLVSDFPSHFEAFVKLVLNSFRANNTYHVHA